MIWQFRLTVSCSSSGSTCWMQHHDTKTAAQLLLQCVSVENCSNKETTSNGAARLMCLCLWSHSSQLRLSLISLFLISLMSVPPVQRRSPTWCHVFASAHLPSASTVIVNTGCSNLLSEAFWALPSTFCKRPIDDHRAACHFQII